MSYIEIEGARTHNLKNIHVKVPKHKLVAFTGVSGSGKSSLVFDTICTEAQRQLIDTFSTYARRRLPQLSRPDVDLIKNISPCIVIDQKRLGRSSRSTIGTVTEIYTYLRMLFSRCGHPFIGWSHLFSFNHPEGMCTACKGIGKRLSVNIEKLIDKTKSIEEGAIQHPSYDIGKWYWREIISTSIIPTDKPLSDFTESELNLLLWAENYPIEYEFRGKTYKKTFTGVAKKLEQLYSNKDEDQLPKNQLEAFKFFLKQQKCSDCNGVRLNKKSLSVQLAGSWTIGSLVEMEIVDLYKVLKELPYKQDYSHMRDVVLTLTNKILPILEHLINIGVGYLSLNRSIATLSGGESQRVKLAKQLDCNLTDMIYILDEPSVGLHPKDINHLIKILYELRDRGNTVLVVEHDSAIVKASDWVIDVGEGAGSKGGTILYSGKVDNLKNYNTPTAKSMFIESFEKTKQPRVWTQRIEINNISKNNLKNIDVSIPLDVLTCFTGVAGSGKSSIIEEFIKHLKNNNKEAIVIDQKPIGKSSRSNPATYIGIFDSIRKLFADFNNVSASLFSFNSQGACTECKGKGYIEMELSFIDDVKIVCHSCKGKRYKNEILKYKLFGKSINEVLELSVFQAITYFQENEFSSSIKKKLIKQLNLLADVGVDYLKLGQSLSTLSGGEAQRIKLAAEIKKSGNIYIMDEPTTGLHPHDIDKLMKIINKIVNSGNSVIVIEHNIDVISQSDWIIDVGPKGGKNGGEIIAQGTPQELKNNKSSITGFYL